MRVVVEKKGAHNTHRTHNSTPHENAARAREELQDGKKKRRSKWGARERRGAAQRLTCCAVVVCCPDRSPRDDPSIPPKEMRPSSRARAHA